MKEGKFLSETLYSNLCDAREDIMRKNRQVCAQKSRREEEYEVCIKAFLRLAAREEDGRKEEY